MKMSDTFTLPLEGRHTATLWQSDAKAIEHAVNHHDALVEALTDLVEESPVYDRDGHCSWCLEGKHREDCEYVKAAALLEQIKNDK